MTDRKPSGTSLQERIARLNQSQAASAQQERKDALPTGSLKQLRSKFEGNDDGPLKVHGSFGLGAPTMSSGMGSADRNRIASGSSSGYRGTSPGASPQVTRTSSSKGVATPVSDRSLSPVPDSNTTGSASQPALSEGGSSVPSSPASSIARSYPTGVPPRLTQELLSSDPPGTRTPMSVSSMNVETGSISSDHNPLDDLSGDITPPLAGTTSAKAADEGGRLAHDISSLSLDVHAPSPRSSMDSPGPGASTPVSTAGSHIDDLAREQATEEQLEAYENEEHDRARSPEDLPSTATLSPPSDEEQRIRPVPLTAHEMAATVKSPPLPDVDESEAEARETETQKELLKGSIVSEVPGNAEVAAQQPLEHIDAAPPGEHEDIGHSKLSMSSTSPVVHSAVPLERPSKVPDAGDLEALRAEGGVKADDDAMATLTGEPEPSVNAEALDEDEPSVKCSDCQADVKITELADHVCAAATTDAAKTQTPTNDFPDGAEVVENGAKSFREQADEFLSASTSSHGHRNGHDASIGVDVPSSAGLSSDGSFPESPLKSDFPPPPTHSRKSSTLKTPIDLDEAEQEKDYEGGLVTLPSLQL